jgi:hypothetical protein
MTVLPLLENRLITDDELDSIVPKKTRKPSKQKDTAAVPKPKNQAKQRDPSPEELASEESSLESIHIDTSLDTPNTSIDSLESSMSVPPPKKRGRPAAKSASATPQQVAPAKPRARSTSAQPVARAKAVASGVKGRKPKLAVVPETQQMEVSVVQEEDEDEQVEFVAKPARQGSILPASITKKASFEVFPFKKRLVDDSGL